MKTLYFDCFSGASGDMILGALIDAGADFGVVRAGLESLNVPGYAVSSERVKKHGIMATQFSVNIAEDAPRPHRPLDQILEIIDDAALPEAVKKASAETFTRLAECEAAVHGAATDQIHFHELGAIDSIADIVGTHLALHTLEIERVVSSPLCVGSGTVETAHGVMPVPAPATALLLKGVPCFGGGVSGELVTPTGAALIVQLAQAFGPMPLIAIAAVGYGSGTRELPDRPNVLRVLIGETPASLSPTETIVIVEANVDDMNPELLPPLVAETLEAGARDAFLTPIIGKKGRPAYKVTVLCEEPDVARIARVLFDNSTTLGLRTRTERRICLDREWKTAPTPWGTVRVKIGRLHGRETTRAPEFEDCRRLAEEAGVPVRTVYEAALAAAVKGELHDA